MTRTDGHTKITRLFALVLVTPMYANLHVITVQSGDSLHHPGLAQEGGGGG